MSEGRSTSESVTFLCPFLLPGMERQHPPGTFEVWTERGAIDVSRPAYLQSMRILLTTSNGVESIGLRREDLDLALARDAAIYGAT